MTTDLLQNRFDAIDDLPKALRSMACTHAVMTVTLNPDIALKLARRIEEGPQLAATSVALHETLASQFDAHQKAEQGWHRLATRLEYLNRAYPVMMGLALATGFLWAILCTRAGWL